jgi:hypothetical protein
MTTLRVWAPLPKTVEVEVDGTRTPLTQGRRVVDRRGRAATAPTTPWCWTAARRGPDPRSGWQPHGVHGPPGVPGPQRLRLDRLRWRACRWPGAVLYELHIGPSPPGGTFDSAVERLDHLVDLGRQRRGAAAVQRLRRPLGLGLRRRGLVRGARAVRRARGAQALRRRLPRPRARRRDGRRLQPLRPGGELPAGVRARTSPSSTRRRGARRSTSTGPARTRCAATSSTTR